MTKMTPAERQALSRAERAKRGLRQRTLYAHDEDWPTIRDMAKALAERRRKPSDE